MSQSSIFSKTPGIQLTARGNSSTVGTATGNITDAFGFQCFYQPGLITVPAENEQQNHCVNYKIATQYTPTAAIKFVQ